MRKGILLAVTLLVAGYSSPAQGNDLGKLLQHFSGLVTGFDELDRRQAEVRRAINDATASRLLTSDEAAMFRADLRRIQEREDQLKASGKRMGFSQSIFFTNQLNMLAGQINQTIAGRQETAPNLAKLESEVQESISRGIASGKLNHTDAEELSNELKRVQELKDAFTRTAGPGGALDAKQTEFLIAELNKVKAKLDEELKMADSVVSELESRRQGVERKIADATSGNRLHPDAARHLRNELSRIAAMQSGFVSSEGALSGEEILIIADELDRLGTLVDEELARAVSSPAAADAPGTAAASPPSGTESAQPSPPSLADKYTDVRGFWAAPYINQLGERGIIGGFPDGSFRPEAEITRAQFAAILVKALDLPVGAPAGFSDVPQSYWASKAIGAVSAKGLVTGFPGNTFKPEDKLTRTQALVILAKTLPQGGADPAVLGVYQDGDQVPSWAVGSVAASANANIIVNHPDVTQIRPNAVATRGEVAGFIYQTLSRTRANLPPLAIGLFAKPQHVDEMPPVAAAPGASINTSGSTATASGTSGAMPAAASSSSSSSSGASAEKLYIYQVSIKTPMEASDSGVAAPGVFRAGDQVVVNAVGSPKSTAIMEIQGLTGGLPMREVKDGIYEAAYTVKRSDNLANGKIVVRLSKGDSEPIAHEYAKLLTFDAKAPAIEHVQPGQDAVVGERRPSIILTFSDGGGSGIDKDRIRLVVNGTDVTSQAVVAPGFLTYRPGRPFLEETVSAEFKVTDRSGNSAEHKWSFKVAGSVPGGGGAAP